MEDQITPMITEAVVGLLGIVLTWAVASVRKVIKRKINSDYLQGLSLRLVDVVETAVREAAQTTVPLIKDRASDGKLTGDEARDIKEAVRMAALDQLATVDRESLEQFFDRGGLERKVDSLIEAAVQKMKEGR